MRRATSLTLSLPCGGIALGKISEDDACNSTEFPGLLQVHQGSVHLPGLHGAIFENQNRAACIEFPGSSDRRFDQVQAAAEKCALA